MINFWKTKSFEQMTESEWESLCDQCGVCCVHKIRDEDTDEIFYTDIACKYLDIETAKCKAYEQRDKIMPGCIRLTPENIHEVDWLPCTCAYRILVGGGELPEWHPLVTGDPDSVRDAGRSSVGRLIHNDDDGDMVDHIVGEALL